MTQEEFSAAIRGSPMTRATLRGLRRDAPSCWATSGTTDDVYVLACALDDREPLARELARWALPRVGNCTHSTDEPQPRAATARPEHA